MNEKELYRFVNEPKYRDKVIASIHKEQDKCYEKKIKMLRKEKERLVFSRIQEIDRVKQLRWENIAGGKLLVNRTEGKVKINQTDILFSDIQGAEIKTESGCRIITQEVSKSKKHASVGGAIVGGLVAGPLGAVTGGSVMGKTKTKGTATSTQIPTYNRVTVAVNVKGFISEIVVLSSQVDQSSIAAERALQDAQAIVDKLRRVSQIPVPSSFVKVEDEDSVKAYDKKIEDKNAEIQIAIDDKPTYDIPNTYRTKEQESMTDAEYLEYLKDEDEKRVADAVAETEEKKRQQNLLKEMKRQEKARIKEEKKLLKNTKNQSNKEAVAVATVNVNKDVAKDTLEVQQSKKEQIAAMTSNVTTVAKKLVSIILSVALWSISIINVLLAIAGLTTGGYVSALFFVLGGLSANPTLFRFLRKKNIKIRVWMCIIAYIITFFVAGANLPESNTDTNGIQTQNQTMVEQ